MTTSVSNMDAANNVAAQQSMEENDSIMGVCPLMQDKVQLVPLRYAMCESEQVLPSSLNASLYQVKGIMLGMRPLNPGYIYALHSLEKETLYCYEVANDGSLTGSTFSLDAQVFSSAINDMIFPRKGTLSTMFSPIALTADRAQILLTATDDQKALMTQVNLAKLDPLDGSKGFSPANTLSQVVDFSGAPEAPIIDSTIGSYQWLIDLNWKPQLLPSLSGMVKPEFSNDYGLLLLNDICGDIVEVAEKSNNLLVQYKQAVEVENNGSTEIEKHEIAQVLTSLMSQETAYRKVVDSVTTMLTKPPKTDDDKQILAQDMQGLAQAISDPDNVIIIQNMRPGGRMSVTVDNPTANRLADELAVKYQTTGIELLNAVEQASSDHRELVEGGIFGKQGMKDVIDDAQMNTFLTQWETRKQTFSQHLEPLIELMKALAPKWHLLAAYLSPAEADNLAQKLDYEDIICSFFKGNDDTWLHDYYYGDDKFPMMVYSDTATNLYGASFTFGAMSKDIATIRNKFFGLKDKLAGAQSWQDKMAKANSIQLLGTISNDDIKARAIQSLTIKNEMMVVALSMHEPGRAHNFGERLGQSFEKMSLGLKTQLQITFEVHSLHWNIPNANVLAKIDSLVEELNRAIVQDRKSREQKIKLKKTSLKITKKGPKHERRRLRKQYNQALKIVNSELSINTGNISRTQNALLKHTIEGGSLVAGASLASVNKAFLAEAQTITKNWNIKEITKELIQKEGKLDSAKVKRLGLSLMLTSLYFYGFYQAVTEYLDEDKDGDLLNVITTGSFALAGSLTLVSSLYNAKLNLALTVHSSTSSTLATLSKVATWSVYSSPITTWLGAWGMGVRTVNAGKDFWKTRSQGGFIKKLSFVRAGVSGAGFIAAFGEAAAYTLYAFRLWRGAAAIAMNELIIATAGRVIKWNVGAFIAFYGIDKLYQYYKWPALVDWASDSLWGEDNQHWSIDEHYQQLNPLIGKVALHTQVINNTHSAEETGSAEMQFHLLLPGVSQPNPDNLKLAFMGFNRHEAKWYNLLPYMLDNADIRPLPGNHCQLSLYLDSDTLYELGIMETQLALQLTTEQGQGPERQDHSWNINCQRVSFGPQENPNVMQTRQWQSDKLPSQPLTPWPLALN